VGVTDIEPELILFIREGFFLVGVSPGVWKPLQSGTFGRG